MMLSGAGMLVAEGELQMKLWMVQSGEGRRRGSVELSERTCWLNPSNYSIGARGESGLRELEFDTLCSWPVTREIVYFAQMAALPTVFMSRDLLIIPRRKFYCRRRGNFYIETFVIVIE
jgi:hypothetical protein